MNSVEELDIKQMIKICWKKKNIFLSIIILSVILGGIYTFLLKAPAYKSSTKIMIDKADISIAELVKSNDIMQEVANSLNVDESYINENVMVNFEKTTKMITISANANDSNEAYNIVVKYQEILKTKLESIYNIKTYNIIEQAQIADHAYNINYLNDMFKCLTIGFGICIIASIYIISVSGYSIYEEIEYNKIILLGKINREKELNSKVKSYISKDNKTIAQLKKVMASIELNKEVSRPKSILITSSDYNAGTTYVVANLAMSYAKSDKKVLIIDSNLKNGIQNKIFNVDSKVGITNLANLEKISIDDVEKNIKQAPINNIYVLPCGDIKINEEMMILEKVTKMIDLIKEQFDIILIDGEPIPKEITSYGWANVVDTVVIVAEYSKTKIEEIVKTKRVIESIDGKVSGVIVNKDE